MNAGEPHAHRNEQPLNRRRVVVTRARRQAQSFGERLERAGASVFYLPLIRITPKNDAHCPGAPEDFDWLIFTSVNTVVHFASCVERAGWNLTDFSRCRVAAIGVATAKALEQKGLAPQVVPDKHVSDALVAALLDAEPLAHGKRALLPQSDLARPVIADGLADAGMQVASLVVYRTEPETLTEEATTALVDFRPEFIAFFSPSAVHRYVAGNLPEILKAHDVRPVYASIGPVTADALGEARLEPILEAKHQHERALIEAIMDFKHPG